MGVKKLSHLFGLINLCKEYTEYLKNDSNHHRYKIIGVERQKKKIKFLVQIRGIKNNLPVLFTPNELIAHDALLKEFSQTDVRAIAYYAFQVKDEMINYKYELVRQEFFGGKTVLVFKEKHTDLYFRKMAVDLASCGSILKKFSFDDVRKIIFIGAEESSFE